MSPIKVMVVEDSAVVRQVLAELLQADSGIQVIAAMADPLFAMQRMKTKWPGLRHAQGSDPLWRGGAHPRSRRTAPGRYCTPKPANRRPEHWSDEPRRGRDPSESMAYTWNPRQPALYNDFSICAP
jgi:CheY-like chemotaxis protein